MFSQGLSSLKKAASTETRLTWVRTSSASFTTSQPNTRAVPESGVNSVPRIRMRVDLPLPFGPRMPVIPDRKSTRLNSSHSQISYAVFCLKKKINVSPTYHTQYVCSYYIRVDIYNPR